MGCESGGCLGESSLRRVALGGRDLSTARSDFGSGTGLEDLLGPPRRIPQRFPGIPEFPDFAKFRRFLTMRGESGGRLGESGRQGVEVRASRFGSRGV